MTLELDTSKVRDWDKTKNNVILFSYGSFCPIHFGHLRMVEEAHKHLSANGYNILATYMSAKPQKNVTTKLTEQSVSQIDRLAMVRLMVSDHPYIMYYFYPHGQAAPARQHLQDEMDSRYQKMNIPIITICGADIIHSIKSNAVFKAGVVCVDRQADFDIKLALERHKSKDRIIFVEAEDWKDKYSSTKVRTALLAGKPIDHLTHPEIIKYIKSHGLWKPQLSINILPDSILIKIFKMVIGSNPKNKLNCSLVCKSWKEFVTSPINLL